VDCKLEMNKGKQRGRLVPSEPDRLERNISQADARTGGLAYDLCGANQGQR
jgi:hypothetical protein